MTKYLTGLLLILTLASCKKWLDVKPESEVSDEELFQTLEGFQEALNGVYMKCTDTALYGAELTTGLPEVLAQNYAIPFSDRYRYLPTSQYRYRDQYFLSRKDAIWKGLYNGIVNCNIILDKLEKQKNVVDATNYALIKGEALGLRAYLHFDALRLFAPSFLNSPSAPGIPYVTTVSRMVTEMSTVNDALVQITADLVAAQESLASDPIKNEEYQVGYPTDENAPELSDPSLFLHNRRHRMNYYAVTGALARVYLYHNEKEKALASAVEIIQAQKFPWTKQADFIAADPQQKDRIMYQELVFSWYADIRERTMRERFQSEAVGLYIDPNSGNAMYETGSVGGEDLRYKEWFRLINNISGDRLDLLKYVRDDEENRHYLVMPAIRLSEMYYIAAECVYDTDPAAAAQYFNTVRANRGIGAPLNAGSKDEFLNELLKEIRKETYAEGQIFYAYKRLHKNIVGRSGTIIPASNNIFVLPLPDDEIEFGGR